jgi:hypothetical protein
MSTKKTGYVPTTFTDAGTETTYEGGKEHDFEPGAYANYKHAGLIGEKPSAKAASDKGGTTA